MNKENEYYTPDIEDFRVGYEFEMNDTWGGWKKLVLTEELFKNPMVGLGSGNEREMWWWKVRTPYLTKEQIEGEGWRDITLEYQKPLLFKGEKSYQDGNYYEIVFSISDKVVNIKTLDDHFIFSGECKSINEFRYICKLLKI